MSNPADDIAALKAATREAHEVFQDLRSLLREGRAFLKELEAAAGKSVNERLEPVVKENVEKLGEATDQAMRAAVEKVAHEFEKLAAIYLGTDKKSQKRGEPSLEELTRRKAEVDYTNKRYGP